MNHRSPDSSRVRRHAVAAAALALAALGVLARCAPWREVFTAQGVIPLGVDPYYHLRRAQLIVDSFPSRVLFDPSLSFPWGSSINWPPGFDLLLALPGLLGLGPQSVLLWSMLVPPLLGGVGVYLVYRLGRAIAGDAAGLIAALFMALMGAATDSGLVGRADHHVLVAPICCGLFLAVLRSVEAHTARRSWAWAGLAAVMAALAVAGWVITPPLYFVPVPVLLGLLRGPAWRARARQAAWRVLGLATLAVAVVVLLIADLERKPFDLYQPSLFIVLPYLVAWLLVVASHRSGLALVVTVGILGLAGAVALAVSPVLRAPVVEAMRTLLDQDPTYSMMLESRSPLFNEGWFDIRGLAQGYTSLVVLVPVLVLWLGAQLWRDDEKKPGRWLLLVYALLACALLMLQARFGEYAAPAVALLFGAGASQGLSRLRAAIAVSERPRRLMALSLVLGLCVLWALSPLVRSPLENLDGGFSGHQQALLRFAERVKPLLASATSHGVPQQGVLTSWLDAHPWLYATGQAVMVTPFGTDEGERANREGFRLWLAIDSEAALRGLEQQRLRYLLCSSIVGQTKPMAIIAGLPPVFEQITGSEQGRPIFAESELFFATLHARLLFEDGAAHRLGTQDLPSLTSVRLLAEADERAEIFGRGYAPFKLFERVHGARLRGRAKPGQEVQAEVTLNTPVGRRFDFETHDVADEGGAFVLTLPYSTTQSKAEVQAVGPYRVRVGTRRCQLEVSEVEVLQGRTLRATACEEDQVGRGVDPDLGSR